MFVEHPSRHPRPLPPVAVSFVECVNRRDLEGLVNLLTEDSYPEYVSYPERIVETDGEVVILGTTTGSHLGMEDASERESPVIWVAEIRFGRMAVGSIVEDSLDTRHRLGSI